MAILNDGKGMQTAAGLTGNVRATLIPLQSAQCSSRQQCFNVRAIPMRQLIDTTPVLDFDYWISTTVTRSRPVYNAENMTHGGACRVSQAGEARCESLAPLPQSTSHPFRSRREVSLSQTGTDGHGREYQSKTSMQARTLVSKNSMSALNVLFPL